jgi:hypothetical protein
VRRLRRWWPWLVVVATLATLGFERAHVLHQGLTMAALFGCAALLVLATRRSGAGGED